VTGCWATREAHRVAQNPQYPTLSSYGGHTGPREPSRCGAPHRASRTGCPHSLTASNDRPADGPQTRVFLVGKLKPCCEPGTALNGTGHERAACVCLACVAGVPRVCARVESAHSPSYAGLDSSGELSGAVGDATARRAPAWPGAEAWPPGARGRGRRGGAGGAAGREPRSTGRGRRIARRRRRPGLGGGLCSEACSCGPHQGPARSCSRPCPVPGRRQTLAIPLHPVQQRHPLDHSIPPPPNPTPSSPPRCRRRHPLVMQAPPLPPGAPRPAAGPAAPPPRGWARAQGVPWTSRRSSMTPSSATLTCSW
jgi:hypothetical protein